MKTKLLVILFLWVITPNFAQETHTVEEVFEEPLDEDAYTEDAHSNRPYRASSVKQSYYNSPFEIRKFDTKSWEKSIADLDYSPLSKEKKEKEKKADTPSENSNNNSHRRNRNYNQWGLSIGSPSNILLKAIYILLGISGIAYIAFRLFSNTTPKTAVHDEEAEKLNIDIENIEENLHHSDIEQLIKITQAKGNYMMAVRLNYLNVIKKLSNSQLIEWKKNKTNKDYLREVKKKPLYNSFKNITQIFEQVWYGNREQLSESDYNKIQPKFSDFIKRIKNK